ncbi:unnamed protein product, partial [Ectocarpus sp. 4 AP-2014]
TISIISLASGVRAKIDYKLCRSDEDRLAAAAAAGARQQQQEQQPRAGARLAEAPATTSPPCQVLSTAAISPPCRVRRAYCRAAPVEWPAVPVDKRAGERWRGGDKIPTLDPTYAETPRRGRVRQRQRQQQQQQRQQRQRQEPPTTFAALRVGSPPNVSRGRTQTQSGPGVGAFSSPPRPARRQAGKPGKNVTPLNAALKRKRGKQAWAQKPL